MLQCSKQQRTKTEMNNCKEPLSSHVKFFVISRVCTQTDLLAFQWEFLADLKSHTRVKRTKNCTGVVLQRQPTVRPSFVNIVITQKGCQMLAFMPAETLSWGKCSLKFAITPAVLKPSS